MRLRLAAFLVAFAVPVAGCTGPVAERAPQEPEARSFGSGSGPAYVALGDSFAAGPGIDQQLSEAGPCQRSTNNYPNFLARKLEVSSFVDVSCSGFTTQQVREDPVTTSDAVLPSQLAALDSDTELVTITLGGNDDRIIGNLFGSCHLLRGYPTGLCDAYVNETLPESLDRVQKNLVQVIEAVSERSPDARIVLVGYLRLVSESGACGDLPVEAGLASAGAQAVDDAQKAAADDAGVEFLSLLTPGDGHDACAGEAAWVNGVKGEPGNGVFMHPKKSGMKAVANQLADLVG